MHTKAKFPALSLLMIALSATFGDKGAESNPEPTLRRGHHPRPHHRRHRLALVFGRHRHSRRDESPPSATWRRAGQAHHRRARQSRRARVHRHAGPVGADHPRRSATAFEDLPGHHHRDHRRGQLRRAGQRRHARRRPSETYEHYHITPDWRTLRQYFARIEKQGMGINLASYVGATSVRGAWCWATPTCSPHRRNCNEMKALVARGNARRSGGSVDGAAIRACALREDRRADRAGFGGERSTAASTPRTCAARATRCSSPSTKPRASAARRIFPSRSGT